MSQKCIGVVRKLRYLYCRKYLFCLLFISICFILPLLFPGVSHAALQPLFKTESIDIDAGCRSYYLKTKIENMHLSDYEILFESSDEAVATINESGIINALAPGNAYITVTAAAPNQPTLTGILNINALVPIDYIVLSHNAIVLNEGARTKVTAEIYPSNASDKTLIWHSSDNKIAAVNNGAITARSKGECTITCTAKRIDGSEYSVRISITVRKPASYLQLKKERLSILPGFVSEPLEYAVYPGDASNTSVTWSSSDPAVATVDASGYVTAVSPGKTVITVKTADMFKEKQLFDTCTVIVPTPVNEIVLSGDNQVQIGKKLSLKGTAFPKNAGNRKIVWSSSDESIARVDAAGIVRAISPGECVITARAADGSGVFAEKTISVISKIQRISVKNKRLNVFEGSSIIPELIISPADATNQTLLWTVSDTSIAYASENGSILGLKAGKCSITVQTTDGSNLSIKLSLNVHPAHIVSVTGLSRSTEKSDNLFMSIKNHHSELALTYFECAVMLHDADGSIIPVYESLFSSSAYTFRIKPEQELYLNDIPISIMGIEQAHSVSVTIIRVGFDNGVFYEIPEDHLVTYSFYL